MKPIEKATNSVAKVPKDLDAPIVLEGIHSTKGDKMPINYPADKKVGYAVVGLGHLSLEEIIPALISCKKSKLTALVSGDPEKLKKVGRQYDVPESAQYSYDSFDEIAQNESIDAVFIVLPNSMHKEFTVRAAKARKHVLCEKPMAVSSDECREMIAACEEARVKLMIAYRIQYENYNTYVKNALENKTIGNVKFIEAQNGQLSANPKHWRYVKALSGGGSLPDIGLYCLNTTRFILDSEPYEVFAYTYSNPKDPIFKEVEETVSWQMKFPGGVLVHCSTHYQTYDVKHYRVLGDEGWIDLENAYAYTGQALKIATKEKEENVVKKIILEHKNQFAAETDYFSACIQNNEQPYTCGEVGLQDHLIMEAIYESAATGKPVSLKGRLLDDLKRGKNPYTEKL